MTDELELSQEYANIRGAQAAKRLFELCLRHQGEGAYPVAQFLVGLCYITNRGEYQWRARIRRLGYPEQSKTFNTKAQAEAWARVVFSRRVPRPSEQLSQKRLIAMPGR